MEETSEQKMSIKGILKNCDCFNRAGATTRKTTTFDELNILQNLRTDYHDSRKLLNLIKTEPSKSTTLDRETLSLKLSIVANTQTPSFGDESDDSDGEFPETPEEKIRRLEFERRRKAHYNEYEAVKLARQLIQEELGNEEEQEEFTVGDVATAKSSQVISEFSITDTGCDGRPCSGVPCTGGPCKSVQIEVSPNTIISFNRHGSKGSGIASTPATH